MLGDYQLEYFQNFDAHKGSCLDQGCKQCDTAQTVLGLGLPSTKEILHDQQSYGFVDKLASILVDLNQQIFELWVAVKTRKEQCNCSAFTICRTEFLYEESSKSTMWNVFTRDVLTNVSEMNHLAWISIKKE